MTLDLWFDALVVMLVMGFMTWLLSLRLRDVSIVDSLWSLMFLAGATVYFYLGSDMWARASLLYALVAIWALRLSLFLTIRNWGEEEDRRYRVIRGNNEPFWIKSLYIVFGLQAVLAWFISLPLLFGIGAEADIGIIEVIAVAVWLIGFLTESVADQQLYAFKRDPANEGKVLDTGVWHYSRHPNYFGESLIWWSYYLFAMQYGPWWMIAAPVLMTLLLLKVSGVSLMEQDIGDRRPGYADYIARTNAFIPWFPREEKDSHSQEENLGAS